MLNFPPKALRALLDYLNEVRGPNGLFISNREQALATAADRCNAVLPKNKAVTSQQVRNRIKSLANESAKSDNRRGIHSLFEDGTAMLNLRSKVFEGAYTAEELGQLERDSNTDEGGKAPSPQEFPGASRQNIRGEKRKREHLTDSNAEEQVEERPAKRQTPEPQTETQIDQDERSGISAILDTPDGQRTAVKSHKRKRNQNVIENSDSEGEEPGSKRMKSDEVRELPKGTIQNQPETKIDQDRHSEVSNDPASPKGPRTPVQGIKRKETERITIEDTDNESEEPEPKRMKSGAEPELAKGTHENQPDQSLRATARDSIDNQSQSDNVATRPGGRSAGGTKSAGQNAMVVQDDNGVATSETRQKQPAGITSQQITTTREETRGVTAKDIQEMWAARGKGFLFSHENNGAILPGDRLDRTEDSRAQGGKGPDGGLWDIRDFPVPLAIEARVHANRIKEEMIAIGQLCRRVLNTRLVNAGIDPWRAALVDLDNLGDDLSTLLAIVVNSDSGELKRRWSTVEQMQAETVLPLGIFLRSLLGAAIKKWTLDHAPQGDEPEPYAENLTKVIGGLNPAFGNLVQMKARAQQLENDQRPQVPAKAREMAARFNRMILHFLGPPSREDLSQRECIGYPRDGPLPLNWTSMPTSTMSASYVPAAWIEEWIRDLTEIFEKALNLRIEMEKMDAQFVCQFINPGAVFETASPGLQPGGGSKRCMLALMCSIVGVFRYWEDPNRPEERFTCVPVQFYPFEPVQKESS